MSRSQGPLFFTVRQGELLYLPVDMEGLLLVRGKPVRVHDVGHDTGSEGLLDGIAVGHAQGAHADDMYFLDGSHGLSFLTTRSIPV